MENMKDYWCTYNDIQQMYMVGQKQARSMLNEAIKLAKEKGYFIPITKKKIAPTVCILERYPMAKRKA